MRADSGTRPLYRPLACWFCLPAFAFLLAPLLRPLGDAGAALAMLAVLMSASVAPMFTLFALAIALHGHFAYRQAAHERLMWILLALAVTANLLVVFTGGGSRLLR
jgi:hypothetical protein